MQKETQISAIVSVTTKDLLERHVRATGIKKGHLVEEALRHHLQALQELPADVVVRPKVVLSRRSGEALAQRRRNGWGAIAQHFEARAEPDRFLDLADGRLLVTGHYRGRGKQGGAILDAAFAHLITVDQGRILGYATVAPGQLEIDDLPAALRKKLPEYPVPVLRLARLAVDEAARGQGLGKELLRFVLQLAIRLAKDYGCTGVLVDAKAEAVAFYGKLGFVPLEVLEGQSDARPAPIPMFLSVREIQAATRRSP